MITDNGGLPLTIEGTIAGSSGSGTATVNILLSTFSGNVVINTLAGDDTVTFDSTFDIATTRGVVLDAGAGTGDVVTWDATAQLASLDVTAETINLNSGTVNTGSGAQTYTGNVVLGVNTTLTSADAIFNGTVDSAASGFTQETSGSTDTGELTKGTNTFSIPFDVINPNSVLVVGFYLEGPSGFVGNDILFGDGPGGAGDQSADQVITSDRSVLAYFDNPSTATGLQVFGTANSNFFDSGFYIVELAGVDLAAPVQVVTNNNGGTQIVTDTSGELIMDFLGVNAPLVSQAPDADSVIPAENVTEFNVGGAAGGQLAAGYAIGGAPGTHNLGWNPGGSSYGEIALSFDVLNPIVAFPATLTVNTSGAVDFNGAVGGNNELGDVKITSTGASVSIDAAFNAASLDIDPPDTITVTAPITTSGGAVSLTASNGVTLSGANADITTGGGALTVDADADDNGTGTFTSDNAGSAINTTGTTDGSVSITAADVDLTGTINAGAATVSLFPSENGAAVSFGTPAGASAVTKLNDALVSGGDVSASSLQVSPDGSRVVYLADQDTDGVTELYSVPIGGGTVTKLNGALVSGGVVAASRVLISPDSSRVVYVADQDTDNVFELYSVPIGGGTVTKLNDALVSGGDVSSSGLQISPDGSRVVYRADQDTDSITELYSVPIGGGTVTKLSGTLAIGGDVSSSGLQISPDSARVIYRADQDTDNVFELYSVPIGGGTATKLNDALVSGGDVSSTGIQISPDSTRVVYVADQDTDLVNELYSVPIGGGTVTKLNDALVTNGDVGVAGLQVSPDSSRVIYRADQDTDNVFELYSVPIGGGTVTKLNGAFVSGGDVSSGGILVSPDGSRVIYVADQDTDQVFELYSVPIGGGTVTKLNGALVSGGSVSTSGLQVSADSTRVIYLADQDTDNTIELYSVPIGGGTATKLNGALVSGGDVSTGGVEISPDSSRVVYVADQDTAGVFELYSVPTDGSAPSSGFTLSDGELDNVTTSARIVVGDSNSGDVTFTEAISMLNATTLEIVTGGNVTETVSGVAFTDDNLLINGTLAPGASAGTFDVDGNLTFNAASTFAVELGGATAGTQYDQVTVAGDNRTVNLNGATLSVTLINAFTPSVGNQFTIIDTTGANPTLNGTLSFGGNALNDGDTFVVGARTFRINYTGGDVILTDASAILTTEARLNGTTLEIDDPTGDTPDQLTLTVSGGNLIITEADITLGIDALGALDGVTGDESNQVTIPLSSFDSISITTRGGADTITLDNLDLENNDSITIDGGADSDMIQTLNNGSSVVGTGAVTLTAETISIDAPLAAAGGLIDINGDDVSASSDISNTGSGAIDIDAVQKFATSGGTISAVNGNVTIDANASGATNGNIDGLRIVSSTVETTGTGDVILTAQSGNTSDDDGVVIVGTVRATGSGNVSMMGTGRGGSSDSHGIAVAGTISSVSGDINLNGTGSGSGAGFATVGAGASVAATGSGTINITGSGVANMGEGVDIDNTVTIGATTGTGGVNFVTDDIKIGPNVTFETAGTISIAPSAANAPISIGGTATVNNGTLNLDDAEIARLPNEEIQIGAVGGTGAVSIVTADFSNASHVVIHGGDVTLGDGTANSGTVQVRDSRKFEIISAGTINQNGSGQTIQIGGTNGAIGLDAATGIGNTGTLSLSAAKLAARTRTSGNIDIQVNAVPLVGQVDLQGPFNETNFRGLSTASNGNIKLVSINDIEVDFPVTADGAGTIELRSAVGSGLEINVTAAVSSTSGDILIESNDSPVTIDATVGSNGAITLEGSEVNIIGGANSITGTGSVSLVPVNAAADINVGDTNDGGAASFDITDTDILGIANGHSLVTIGDSTAGTGAVDVNSSTFVDNVEIVGGSIVVTGLDATGNTATLTARVSNILDGSAGAVDVTADALIASAVNGIGQTSDELDTNVATLNLTNASGQVAIEETDSVDITGATLGTSTATLIADDFTLSGAVGGSGDLTVRPNVLSQSISVGAAGGLLSLTDADLANITAGFNSVTIGSTAGTGTVTIDTATVENDTTIAGGTIVDSAGTDLTVNNSKTVTLAGRVAPGASPGILSVTGNFAFGAGETYEVEIGGTSPGTANTDHDQISVTNGDVTIPTNAILDLQSFNGFVPGSGQSFTIIDLVTSGKSVTGNFQGLPEGQTIANVLGSPLDGVITYQGGTDNNDVVIQLETAETEVSIDGNGNVVVTDTNGGTTNDNLTITADGTSLTIVDANGEPIDLVGTLNGGTGDNSPSVTIPLNSFAGKTLIINSLGGNDTINVSTLSLLSNQGLTINGGTGSDTANVNGDVNTNGGAVSINVSNGFNVDAMLTTGGGALDVNADTDQDGTGSFTIVGAMPQMFVEQAKLTGGASAGDALGSQAAAISGDTAVLGNASTSVNGARVFVRSAGVWTEQALLTPSDGVNGDRFGFNDVAIDGDTIVVSSTADDSFRGAAYVFTRSGTTWTEQAKIVAPVRSNNAEFGTGIALDGDTLLVGSPFEDSGAGGGSGAGYVFTRSGSTWSLQQQLVTSDTAANLNVGINVALDGDTAVLTRRTGSGAAYVFTRSGTTWTEQAIVTGSDSVANDLFGNSVAIDVDTLAVGAPRASSERGAVYVFTRSGSTWTEQQKFFSNDPVSDDRFADSIAVQGDLIIAGAPQDDETGNNFGAAFVFERSGGVWSQIDKLTPSVTGGANFGPQSGLGLNSVDLDGTSFVIGAADSSNGNTAGAGFIFENTPATVGGSIAAGSGNVTVIAADAAINGALAGNGSLTLQPSTTTRTIGVGASATGDFNIDTTDLSNLTDGFSGITIGDATAGTGAVDVNASTATDPLTIVGGSIAATELDAGPNAVALTARTGAVTDGGNAGTDVTAGPLTVSSVSGVGTGANGLETSISSLEADGGSGGINITNTTGATLTFAGVAESGSITVTHDGSLRVATVGGTTGVTITDAGNNNAGGAINLTGNSLTVDEAITNNDGGNVDLNSTGMAGAGASEVLYVTTGFGDATNIPAALQADGHTVTVVTNAGPTLAVLGQDLSAYGAVYVHTGDVAHNDTANAFTNLNNYVNGGGAVFISGRDALASPSDPLVISLAGGTGSFDGGGAPLAIANVANSLTTGVVDIRGVVPIGGFTDRDVLTGLGVDTTAVATDASSNALWTLRQLGAGEVAYVSNGSGGSPGANEPSWLDTSPGGAGVFNAALRNYAAAHVTPAVRLTVNASVSSVDGNGNVLLTSASNVNQTAGTISAAGTGTVTVRADDDIEAGSTITTAGGTIVLNSDRDASGEGGIDVNGGTINSNGGNITLGGGADPTTTAAFGSANIGDGNEGVAIDNGSSINAGAGSLSIRGTATQAGGQGVALGGNGTNSITTTSGTITINGNATATGDRGVQIAGANSSITSTSGNITINGDSLGSSDGITIDGPGAFRTDTGVLTLTGSSTSGDGIRLNSGTIGGGGSSGDINLITDGLNLAGGTVQSSGNLTIQPLTPSESIGISDNDVNLGAVPNPGTLNLTDAELGRLADGFSLITFGDINNGTGLLTVTQEIFNDPVRFVAGSIVSQGINTGANDATLIARTGSIGDGGYNSIADVQAGNGQLVTLSAVNSIDIETAIDDLDITNGSGTVLLNELDFFDVNSASLGSSTTTFQIDDIDFSGAASGTGTLTVEAQTLNRSMGFGGAAGGLNLSDADLANLTSGFSSVNFFSGGTSGVATFDTATFNDNVNITAGSFADSAGTDITMSDTSETVALIGTVNPSDPANDLEVVGNFAFGSNNTFEVGLGGSTAADYDQLRVTSGGVSVTSNVMLDLQQLNGFSPQPGDSFTIIDRGHAGSGCRREVLRAA